MRLLYRGQIYESESKSKTGVLNKEYSDKLQKNSRLILDSIIQAYNNDIKIVDQDRFKLMDLLSALKIETPEDLKDLYIGYAKDEGFYYHIMATSNLKYPLIELPDRLRKTGTLYARDYTGIAHELNHYYQDLNGYFNKQGYNVNFEDDKNFINGYNFGYVNNELEINSFLHEMQLYLKENKAFATEVADYDFGPFMEEMISKFLKVPEKDFNMFYNEVLTDDTRQQISTSLYAIWKKLRN